MVAALFTYCDGKNRSTPTTVTHDSHSALADHLESKLSNEITPTSPPSEQDGEEGEEVIPQVNSGDSEEVLIGPHLAQINVLYHLLKAAPHVLHRL